MGLAASQVRLLQLTSRQHRIEYQAQKIQAQKLQLSNESDTVYNNYMRALDAKKVQYKYVESDGTVSYKDATFNAMFGDSGLKSSTTLKDVQNQYALQILNGENASKFYVTKAVNTAYNSAMKVKQNLSTIDAFKDVINSIPNLLVFYKYFNDNNVDLVTFKKENCTVKDKNGNVLVQNENGDPIDTSNDAWWYINDRDPDDGIDDQTMFQQNKEEYQTKYFMKYILGLSENTEITSANWEELRDIYISKVFATYMDNPGHADTHGNHMTYYDLKPASNQVNSKSYEYYEQLGVILQSGNGVVEFDSANYGDDYEWLTNMLANGEVLLHKFDPEAGDDLSGAWTEVAVATDLMLQEVADDKELKKAEAVYEAENARINRKDAQYDTLLSQTETERNAIKTEMESLKSVRNENIEKTFKLFS